LRITGGVFAGRVFAERVFAPNVAHLDFKTLWVVHLDECSSWLPRARSEARRNSRTANLNGNKRPTTQATNRSEKERREKVAYAELASEFVVV